MGERPSAVTFISALFMMVGCLGLLQLVVSLFIGTIDFGEFLSLVLLAIILGVEILLLLTGWFLLQGKNWARSFGIAFGVLSIPIGLIIVYFLWFDKDCKAFFEAAKQPSLALEQGK